MGVAGLLITAGLARYLLSISKKRRNGIITNCVPANISQAILPIVGGAGSQINHANNPKQSHNQPVSNCSYQCGWWQDFRILISDLVSWGLVLLLCFLLFKSQSASTFSHLSLLISIVTTISVAELGTISVKLIIHTKYAGYVGGLTVEKGGANGHS